MTVDGSAKLQQDTVCRQKIENDVVRWLYQYKN